ncbi:hypothetical protein KIH39_17435 [Telmatocola sphagniphila]|uniref:Protein BatD n=1 Tax=Telmatocola sphagniphila TaxID=1123043 RepID=A0A8E6B2C5_9BACT|nr:hypothetical protein [Telmatocola sphagniphila]QVL30628.1 hypothetical protein KIH39_17435 [Telmatocola sphagniphila]
MPIWIILLGLLIPQGADIQIPVVGRPAQDFYNAAGEKVVVLARANKTAVTTEEWVTYTLEISGLKNRPDVEMPKLENIPGFRESFQVEHLPESDKARDDQRIFRYRLRPRLASVREIPPFAFYYYDPRDSNTDTAFRLTLASSIPLAITAAKEVNLKTPAANLIEDWLRSESSTEKFFDRNYLILLPLALGSPILLVGVLLFEARRKVGHTRVSLIRQRLLSWQNLAADEQAERARRIVLQYLQRRYQFDPAIQSTNEVLQILKNAVPSKAQEPTRQFLEQTDAAMFGGMKIASNWPEKFDQLIASLGGESP